MGTSRQISGNRPGRPPLISGICPSVMAKVQERLRSGSLREQEMSTELNLSFQWFDMLLSIFLIQLFSLDIHFELRMRDNRLISMRPVNLSILWDRKVCP